MNVWFVVSEAEGLIKSGGLADVAKALPRALKNLGHDIAITLPAYRTIPGIKKAEIVLETRLEFWPHIEYKVRKLELDGVPVYAVDCPHYFDRPELYAEKNRAYDDNGERFAFFCSAALDCLHKLGKSADIIHCNDWHTGMVPFLLKTRYQDDSRFEKIRSILTVHNAIFQGIYSYEELAVIPETRMSGTEYLRYSESHIGMLKAGVACADKINAVSPNYASELITPLGSHGLYDDFVRRKSDLCGILNGCDYSEWNPENDLYLPLKYTAELESLSKGKAEAKKKLQKIHKLEQKDVPIFGMVCRLTHQKGFDYLLPVLEEFLRNDVQMVMIGTGAPEIAGKLRQISLWHEDKLSFTESYSNKSAHLIEAGADFFLMPSEFEACGLNQIYSMAYGTLPVVREVGGLKDTVVDYHQDPENGTGFSFYEPDPRELLITMQRALIFYHQHPEKMKEMQLRGMKMDFGWHHAAEEYVKMYHSALSLC